MIPNWLTGFPYSVMHSLNLDWLLKKVASIDPAKYVQTINDTHKPDPETGNLNLTALNVGALPINDPAADADKLGGKLPGYYTAAANLLINTNFVNPVNQRGKPAYSTSGYTIDAWYFPISNMTCSLSQSGVTITNNRANEGYWQQTINQTLMRDGKVYTFAAKVDGKINMVTTTIPANTDILFDNKYKLSILFSSAANSWVARVTLVNPDTSVTLEWATLYENAYSADTLPEYVPLDFNIELSRCQRYFLRVNCKNKPLGFGHAFTNEAIRILIPTPTSMSTAKAPSITFYDNEGAVVTANAGALVASGGQLFTPTAVISDGVARENGIIALCTVSGATNYETADLYCPGIVDISVEP